MRAEEALQAGNLQEAVGLLKDDVRKNPADAKLRVFLFQALSVAGDWDRALNQLDVVGDLDDGTLAMVQTYRQAIACERLREEIFAGRRTPLVFGEPEEWIAVLLEALRVGAEGHHQSAAELRDRAFESAETTGGKIDDEPFEWIADADTRLGPMLEAVIHGRYYWVPFSRIAEIRFEKPSDLRDLVWTAAFFRWANGGEAAGLIPTRYPGTVSTGDDALLLSRKTEWQEGAGGGSQGLGQRMLATDAGEYPLLDVRNVALDTGPAEGAPEGPPPEADG